MGFKHSQYKLNINLQSDLKKYKKLPLQNYIDYLKENCLLLRLSNVTIDLFNIVYRKFKCNPKRCLYTIKNKRKIHYNGACCTLLDIQVSQNEIRKIKHLDKEIKKIIPQKNAKNLFTLNDLYQWIIEKRDGLCVFAYLNKEGILRCAIETVCRKQTMPVSQYKPHKCYIWPLSIHEIEDGYFLTLRCLENTVALGYDEISVDFKCLTRHLSNDPPVYLSLGDTLTLLFGERFYKDLINKISSIKREL